MLCMTTLQEPRSITSKSSNSPCINIINPYLQSSFSLFVFKFAFCLTVCTLYITYKMTNLIFFFFFEGTGTDTIREIHFGLYNATVGSVMTKKCGEGYPGARYYGGNEYVSLSLSMCSRLDNLRNTMIYMVSILDFIAGLLVLIQFKICGSFFLQVY